MLFTQPGRLDPQDKHFIKICIIAAYLVFRCLRPELLSQTRPILEYGAVEDRPPTSETGEDG